MTAAPKRYSRLQKVLHWTIAMLIVGQFVWHFVVDTFPMDDPGAMPFKAAHGLSGMVILALMLGRLFVRWRRGVPPLPEAMGAGQQRVAHLMHVLLYVLVIAQTVSGIASGPAGSPAFGSVHGALSLALVATVQLHVAGAVWHMIRRDGIGTRMFAGR